MLWVLTVNTTVLLRFSPKLMRIYKVDMYEVYVYIQFPIDRICYTRNFKNMFTILKCGFWKN
jgi:hypothetical protein